MRLVVVGIVSALLLCVSAIGARAHKVHHPDGTSQDYSKFMRPNSTISCCNKQDCQPAERWIVQADGSLVMLIRISEVSGNKFVTVPWDKVLKEHSDDGRAHWCGKVVQSIPTGTYCAILPPTDARAPGAALVQFAGLEY